MSSDAGLPLKFTVGIAFKFQRFIAFQKSEKLVGGQDWGDLDVAVFRCDVEALPRLEVECLSHFLWNDDLVFGRQ